MSLNVGESILVKTDHSRRFLWEIIGHGVCRSCDAPLYWCLTHGGKKIPVDVPTGEETITTSHFATCPQSLTWRR